MINIPTRSLLIVFVFALMGFQACKPSIDINSEIMRCDTSNVSRVEIRQNEEQTILQRKKKNGFWVNNAYEADTKTVRKFLELPYNMIIKMPAAKSDNDSLKRYLERSGIDIRFFGEDDLLCHWYAADYNVKYKASPLMNAGADRVFFVELPGVDFDFTDRCRANPDFWIDKTIIALDYYRIAEIGLQYFGADSVNSFQLQVRPDTVFLFDYENELQKNVDLKAVGQYLTYFDEVNFFKTTSDLSSHEQDSIIASQPIFELELKDTDGQVTQVRLFSMQNETLNRRHKHLAYVQLNDEDKLRKVKYFAFDLLMKKPDYFMHE